MSAMKIAATNSAGHSDQCRDRLHRVCLVKRCFEFSIVPPIILDHTRVFHQL